MAYRRTVLIAMQDNGPGVPKSYFYNPGTRSRPIIWFAEEAGCAGVRQGGWTV